MAPISKPMSTATWVRKPSSAGDYRYNSALNSDGNSSNYSSGEENVRIDKKSVPSFMISDDLNGRSYVDPWDMENYSFLRRQLEDISLSDNELSSTPAFESGQSDFYYVPLDNNGSPQYQYKHYIDSSYKDGFTPPLVFRDDSYNLVAGIDEHDFYNEYLDTPHPSLQSVDSYLEYSNFSNPSRQSERSRFNNQDYQTYTPPSIIKDIPERYQTLQKPSRQLSRRSSRRSYSDLQLNSLNLDERYVPPPPPEYVEEPPPRPRKNLDFEIRQHRRKSLSDVKLNLNRRKSFHELSNEPEPRSKPDRRRKSVLDHPHVEERRPAFEVGAPPEPRPREKITRRRSTCEIATDIPKIGKNFRNQRIQRKSILQATENVDRIPSKESFREVYSDMSSLPSVRPYSSNVPDSSLVYVYETAKRRRKMVLPNIAPEVYGSQDFRYNSSDIEDAFSMDPIENYMQRPLSRYTMTNYGHLKIDYSCSWNCLDQYIAHRVRT